MWRDIDSLRRQNALSRQQNEELRKENEANARETEQIEQEIEQIEQEIEQIDRETEQIERETAILRRQNKALAFLESRAFDKMIKELAGPGEGDTRHPLDRIDVGLLCEKLVEHGCDERDLPFLLDALDVEKGPSTVLTSNQDCKDAPIIDLAQNSADNDHNIILCSYRNNAGCIVELRGNWLRQDWAELEGSPTFTRVVFPFEIVSFHAPRHGMVEVIKTRGLESEMIPSEHLLAEPSLADRDALITQSLRRIARKSDLNANANPDCVNDFLEA